MYLTKEIKEEIFAKHGGKQKTQDLQKVKSLYSHTELAI